MIGNFTFFKISVFFFLIFLLLFFFSDNSLAWTEHKCESGCGGNLLYQDCHTVCDEYDKDGKCIRSHISCSSWKIDEDCQSWQKCALSGCFCAGECLAVPTTPSPVNGATEIKLPVTLNWNEINGAGSYRYKIDGVMESYTANNSTTVDEYGSCLLKSDADYNWAAQACCSSDGTDCSSWSNGWWSFKTSLAPQLISPKNNGADVSVPLNLDWCDVAAAKSWLLKIFYIKDNVETCHPWLVTNGICGAEEIQREKIPIYTFPDQKTFYSELSDTRGFFTKDTEYRWEVATCLQDNCSDFSQKWGFKTALTPLPSFNRLYPPDDPNGKAAVGLPLTLTWKINLALTLLFIK